MKTEILVITDRSGSMASIKETVISGYNSFIADQKTQEGECRVTYTQFDSPGRVWGLPVQRTPINAFPINRIQSPVLTDGYDVVYQARALAEVPLLDAETFVPRNGTALFDAIGRTLTEQGERIKKEAWADLVIVCIITDGDENQSTKYTREQVQGMVKHAEEHGWKFVFLAANQDAFAAARSFGSAGAYAATFNASASGTTMAYASTSETVKSMRGGMLVNNVILKQTFDTPESK